jgi:hypothetical protein
MKDVVQILLRCEQAYQKTLDENAAEYDARAAHPGARWQPPEAVI